MSMSPQAVSGPDPIAESAPNPRDCRSSLPCLDPSVSVSSDQQEREPASHATAFVVGLASHHPRNHSLPSANQPIARSASHDTTTLDPCAEDSPSLLDSEGRAVPSGLEVEPEPRPTFRWTLDAQRAPLPAQIRLSTTSTTSSCSSRSQTAPARADHLLTLTGHHQPLHQHQHQSQRLNLKTSRSVTASPLIPIPAFSFHDRFFAPRSHTHTHTHTHTHHVKGHKSTNRDGQPFDSATHSHPATPAVAATMRHSAVTARLTPPALSSATSTNSPRPMSSTTPPPVPPSPSALSTTSSAPHAPPTNATRGKVVRHALRSFASAIGLKSLVQKEKSIAPPAPPPRAMSEIGPQSNYSPPTTPTGPPLLSLPRLLDVHTSSPNAIASNNERVPLPMPYALATADGGAYYESGRPATAPPGSGGSGDGATSSIRKRSRGASILFDGLDWDVRNLSSVLAAIGDDTDEYPPVPPPLPPPPSGRVMLSGIHAQQQGDITGSSDEDLDRFYDAHAEAYAAETLSRQHGTLRASRDLSRDSPLSSTSSSFPSERVSVIHSRNASPTAHALAQADDGASTRAMQVGSPSTPQIHPPRRVDSLLAPTLASLAAGPASRHPTPSLDDDHDLDNSPRGEYYPVDADSTALLLALPARDRLNQSVSPPATMIAAAEAAAIPRRGGTAESYEVVGADAFAGVAAVTASGAESPVVPPRTASIGAVAKQVAFADHHSMPLASEQEPRDSPKRTMTPPSTSRFVGGGQGTLRRRAATAAGGHAGVAR